MYSKSSVAETPQVKEEIKRILEGLDSKSKRKTIAKAIIVENAKKNFGVKLPVDSRTFEGEGYKIQNLVDLINCLSDSLAEAVSNYDIPSDQQ